MLSDSPNKVRGLIHVAYGILSSFDIKDLELETKKVPVSLDPYVYVSFGFTTKEDERKDNANRLVEIRSRFIDAVREKGMNVRAEDGPLFKHTYRMWQDGVEASFEVDPVLVDFYLPHFRVQPWIRRPQS